MPSWVSTVVKRIRELAAADHVRFTYKALFELASLDLGLDQDDAVQVLRTLEEADGFSRLRSSTTKEWLYVFKPAIGATVLYVKIVIRSNCIVVSFHEDEEESDDETP